MLSEEDQQKLDELKKYYSNLLIVQYHSRPKAKATVELLAGLTQMNLIPLKMEKAFDLNYAVGKQLDILGLRVSVTRDVYLRDGTPATLNDEEFRMYIRFQIASLALSASIWDIKELLLNYFNDDVRIVDLFKTLPMTVDYFVFGGSPRLLSALIKQNMLPRPLGVGIRMIVDSPKKKVFGYQTSKVQTYRSAGFNTSKHVDLDTHWLRAKDVQFLN